MIKVTHQHVLTPIMNSFYWFHEAILNTSSSHTILTYKEIKLISKAYAFFFMII
jgi:hypothetical protein